MIILNKRQTCSGQYDTPSPVGGMWDQLKEQSKAKQQLQLISKYEKFKQSVSMTDSANSKFQFCPKGFTTKGKRK